MNKYKLKTNKAYCIQIPHLNYKIIYGVKPEEFKGKYEKSIMMTEDVDKNTGQILFRKTPEDQDASTVAHEVLHILQLICQHRNIKMEEEMEHMGYLMQYIHNEIYGRKYETAIL